MLQFFEDFRKKLDDVMVECMHDRITMWGYGYSGRFIKWYAEYYHGIKVDYVIALDAVHGQAWDREIFVPSLFDYDYKDVKNSILWITEPINDELQDVIDKNGYQEGVTCFDFCKIIYEGHQYNLKEQSQNAFDKFKSGKRDIQFLEWLEYKYDCNFVTAIENQNFVVAGEHGRSYRCTTPKEIFPMLDKCHCVPKSEDAIFDFGCGKGGAMISFLDYGFERVGGVEYEPDIFRVLKDNQQKLELSDEVFEVYNEDAANITTILDSYNYFYFWQPFDDYIFKKCLDNICESYGRHKRKLRIISPNPCYQSIMKNSDVFRLVNQFTVDIKRRVVDIYETT